MAGEDNQDRTSGSGAPCGETRRSWVQIPPVPHTDGLSLTPIFNHLSICACVARDGVQSRIFCSKTPQVTGFMEETRGPGFVMGQSGLAGSAGFQEENSAQIESQRQTLG